MPHTWFRLYSELLDDPKVQTLPPDVFKTLINIWCIASEQPETLRGTLPTVSDVTFRLRFTEQQCEEHIAVLVQSGLLEREGNGTGVIKVHGWETRQYQSDSSTERVKRFRKRYKAVTETPPEQNRTDQSRPDTEQSVPKKRKVRLPDNWQPNEKGRQRAIDRWGETKTNEEIEAFKDWHISHESRLADWDRAWGTWMANDKRWADQRRQAQQPAL